ncbi:MAG TPA: MFS transporter [Stellaceae bacterium]|jgi:EmrB/QacA subfamily drug resistance transporter|nr:MFS transporter [Stellaceae bacterium]
MTLAQLGAVWSKGNLSSQKSRPSLVLLTTCLGILIAQVDTSVVNLALAPIGKALGAPVSVLQWVIDAYNLVYASLLLMSGTLADLYGRRRIFALGIATFTIGSLICGFAPDEGILIAGRALSGLGAALLVPTSLAILAVTYEDAAERAHAIGIWASCYGVALAIGPSLGGFLVHGAGWRSIFLMIVPFALVALGLTLRALPESNDPQGRRLDLPGQGLAVVTLALVTLAAIEGPHWSTSIIIISLVIALITGAAFLIVERRTEGALLPLSILTRRGLAVSMAVASLMTFGMYGMLFLVPLYLQQLRGASVIAAGLELLPLSVLYVIVSHRSGPLATKFGARAAMTGGMAAMGIGCLLLSFATAQTSLIAIELYLAILGIGLGLNTGPVNSVAVAAVPPARSGTASGLLNTARMIGATLGVALMGTVFAHYSGQGGSNAFTNGMRAALWIGGAGELLGAVIAFARVRGDALARRD